MTVSTTVFCELCHSRISHHDGRTNATIRYCRGHVLHFRATLFSMFIPLRCIEAEGGVEEGLRENREFRFDPVCDDCAREAVPLMEAADAFLNRCRSRSDCAADGQTVVEITRKPRKARTRT